MGGGEAKPACNAQFGGETPYFPLYISRLLISFGETAQIFSFGGNAHAGTCFPLILTNIDDEY